jgi:glutamate-1-semialdehyde aminotransferase
LQDESNENIWKMYPIKPTAAAVGKAVGGADGFAVGTFAADKVRIEELKQTPLICGSEL